MEQNRNAFAIVSEFFFLFLMQHSDGVPPNFALILLACCCCFFGGGLQQLVADAEEGRRGIFHEIPGEAGEKSERNEVKGILCYQREVLLMIFSLC
jgi:hypothetical protein